MATDLRILGLAACLTFLPPILASGCASGTGGEPIELSLSFVSAAPSGRFETMTGWEVRLEEAHLALGAVYLNENPALLAQWSEYLLPTAHAHAGDASFAGGEVKGEWLGQIAFDALAATPRRIEPVPGVAGPIASYTLLVAPPRNDLPDAEVLRGYRAYVVGVASKEDRAVAFEGGLGFPAGAEDDPDAPRIDGLPLDAELATGSRLRIAVDPRAWLDEAHFDRLLDEEGECLETTAAGRCAISADSQVHAAWLVGIRTRDAFQGGLEP